MKLESILENVKELRDQAVCLTDFKVSDQTKVNSRTLKIFKFVMRKESESRDEIIKEIIGELNLIRRRFGLESTENLDLDNQEKPFVIRESRKTFCY